MCQGSRALKRLTILHLLVCLLGFYFLRRVDGEVILRPSILHLEEMSIE